MIPPITYSFNRAVPATFAKLLHLNSQKRFTLPNMTLSYENRGRMEMRVVFSLKERGLNVERMSIPHLLRPIPQGHELIYSYSAGQRRAHCTEHAKWENRDAWQKRSSLKSDAFFLAATRGVGKERRRTWHEADIYEFIYFDLTRSLAFRRRERVADCYPFQTSVFGTKIQLTLQLITVARFEGTARVKLKIDLHGWIQRKLVRSIARPYLYV